MDLNKATRFVLENVQKVPSCERYDADGWACVDGRVTGNVDRLTAPSGTLGFEFAVFAGVEAHEEKHGQLEIDFDHLIRVIEDRFGGMSCHTDGHAIHDGKTRICAGCGHCNGALEGPEDYGLREYRDRLLARIDALRNRGVNPEVLLGEHNEMAVFVMEESADDMSLIMSGTGRDGEQAFICHFDVWIHVVGSLASEVAKCATGVDVKSLSEDIRTAAKRQLGVTLRRLAKGLPVYRVSGDEEGVISVVLIADDAATMLA